MIFYFSIYVCACECPYPMIKRRRECMMSSFILSALPLTGSELSAGECHPNWGHLLCISWRSLWVSWWASQAWASQACGYEHVRHEPDLLIPLRLLGTWYILMSPLWRWSWSHLILRSTYFVLEVSGEHWGDIPAIVQIAILERLSSSMLTPNTVLRDRRMMLSIRSTGVSLNLARIAAFVLLCCRVEASRSAGENAKWKSLTLTGASVSWYRLGLLTWSNHRRLRSPQILFTSFVGLPQFKSF